MRRWPASRGDRLATLDGKQAPLRVASSTDARFANDQIAIKSVYNRLRHCERVNEKFQRQGGKWFLRSPQTPEPPPTS